MTDMPETIRAARSKSTGATMWWPEDNAGGTEYRRADPAPTREQIEAMVRPLRWFGGVDVDWTDPGAEGPGYNVGPTGGRYGAWARHCQDWEDRIGLFDSLDEAKAACFGHHTARILRALGMGDG